MIAVQKSLIRPASLNGVAVPVSPDDVSFDIYGAQDVKDALRSNQNEKCAYCERHLNGDFGAVEHYRPKKKYQAAEHAPMHKGYYWLAYDWDNLLYSCSECNTRYKRCLFPLLDESKRNIAGKDISQEKPLLINPAKEDPSSYIAFSNEYLVSKIQDQSTYAYKKAVTTIQILQLNDREDLVEARRKAWKIYVRISQIAAMADSGENAICEAISKEVQKVLTSLIDEKAEFLGMLRNQAVNLQV